MIDLPENPPPPVAPSPAIVQQCAAQAGRHFKINPMVIEAIAAVEGGKIGTISRNTNGTSDLGVMQINTINLPAIQKRFPGVDWRDLVYKPCVNIGVATWFLSKKIKGASEFWIGVGNYHSKTPHLRKRYLKKIYTAYKKILQRNNKRSTYLLAQNNK